MKNFYILAAGKYQFDPTDVPYQVAVKVFKVMDESNSRTPEERNFLTVITTDVCKELDSYITAFMDHLKKIMPEEEVAFVKGRLKVEYGMKDLDKYETVSVDMMLDTDNRSFTYPPSLYLDVDQYKGPEMVIDDPRWRKHSIKEKP